MKESLQGKHIITHTSSKARAFDLRFVRWEDLDEMTAYINELSQENVFATFSGEVVTPEQEARFLADVLVQMEFGNKVMVGAFEGDKLRAIADVTRVTNAKERKKHLGLFAISVAKGYREEGLGFELMKVTIEQAKQYMPGLRAVYVEVYGSMDITSDLYAKMGFVEGGRMPGGLQYKGEFIDDITMIYPLVPVEKKEEPAKEAAEPEQEEPEAHEESQPDESASPEPVMSDDPDSELLDE